MDERARRFWDFDLELGDLPRPKEAVDALWGIREKIIHDAKLQPLPEIPAVPGLHNPCIGAWPWGDLRCRKWADLKKLRADRHQDPKTWKRLVVATIMAQRANAKHPGFKNSKDPVWVARKMAYTEAYNNAGGWGQFFKITPSRYTRRRFEDINDQLSGWSPSNPPSKNPFAQIIGDQFKDIIDKLVEKWGEEEFLRWAGMD